MLACLAMSPNVGQLEEHRAAIAGHCYRMLGSVFDADDAVQETMVRAWRALERFDGRSSLRTWLTRIATNACLDALAGRERRALPVESGSPGRVDDDLNAEPAARWLEPAPEHRFVQVDADPSEKALLRESIRLAFVAALQRLPPKQRAALLLTEVLGWSAAEVADAIDTSVPAVNSAVQRARATLGTLGTRGSLEARPLTAAQTELVARYVQAFESYDVDALTALLREDATLSMPPYSLWLRGRASIADWLLGRGCGCRGSRLVPVAASGSPAFAQYRPSKDGGYRAWAIIVLELDADRVASMTSFLDVERLFPAFGLPLELAK